ncbi:MAG: cadmium-translocating P-type ATPase [Clostridiales bacterium]|nr:cadmium-translocating P-type ATPase [Clostridiales bacterium]
MEKEQKNELYEILIGAALLLLAWIAPITGAVRAVVFIAIYIFAAREVLFGMVKEAKEGEIFTEETLMSVATIGALILGEFPEAVAVMLLYRLGEWFADLAVDKSRDSISALAQLRPDTARVIRGGSEAVVPAESVQVGEIIVLLPGERVPLDAEIISGSTTVDTSSLTGESLPRDRKTGDEIFSSCVNLTGRVEARVIAPQEDSAVTRILNMTREASERKSKSENFIRRFAKVYTPAVFALAVLAATVPSIITGDWATWVHRALVFLTVSCPCALVVSVPLTFFCGIGAASRKGVLVKGSAELEKLAQAEICAFDKTGTLTTGGFTVSRITPADISEAELIKLAAAAERFSNHPVARAVAGLISEYPESSLIEERPGMGVAALVEGRRVLAGNLKLMNSEGVRVASPEGSVLVAADGRFIGSIQVTDDIKPSAARAVAELKRMGIKKAVMLSGDKRAAAEEVGRAAGLDEVVSELLPEGKVEKLKEISKQGRTLYTGDGINDAPVLAEAFVGAAMGGLGSDAAIETADVIIMDDDLNRLPSALGIARRTVRIARENIVISLAVKFLILILGLFITIPMYLAVIGDVGMLLVATLNALRALSVRTERS